MNHPSIDILMAVYNGEKFVIPQLQSIMEQSYSHLRIIIRDNCSSDNTVSLIETFAKKHPGKIQLIRGDVNLGAKGNFAALMDFAQADYIMFSDADDIWLPGKVEKTLNRMMEIEKKHGHHTPLLVHTDLKVVDRNLNVINPSFWKYSGIDPLTADRLNRLLIHNVITGCTLMINKPLLELAKPIPETAIMHDWWIGFVACAFGHISALDEPTLLYRQHGGNDTGAKPGVNWKSPNTCLNAIGKAINSEKRKQLRGSLNKTIQQANSFLDRFENRLSEDQRILLRDYAALEKSGSIMKRYLLLRHGFFKNGLAKNVGTFLLI